MAYLIDLFTPADLLHFVSIANKYKILNTEDKRYLIALRMSAPWVEGVFQTDEAKKNRFYRVFSQFLKELGPGQGCDNHACPTCDRVQALREDFHGKQDSEEFALFLHWFQNGGKAPARKIAPAVQEAPLSFPAEQAEQKNRPELLDLTDQTQAVPLAQETLPPAEPSLDRDSETPHAGRNQSAIVRGAFSQIPVFQVNSSHPVIVNFSALVARDLSMLDAEDLRRHSLALKRAGEHMLELLGCEAQDSQVSLNISGD